MLENLLSLDHIQILDAPPEATWQQMIRQSAQPLLKNQTINSQYVDQIIRLTDEKGPYMNIGSGVVLAHARPEDGSHAIGLSLLKTKKPVTFVQNDRRVQLWFVLAATDNHSHLEILRSLSQLLGNPQSLTQLKNAQSTEELAQFIYQTGELS